MEVDAEGHQVGHNLKTINLNPAQPEHDRLLRDGLSFSETIPVEKNAAEVRLVLRDVGNGAIGSVIIPLEKLFAVNSAQKRRRSNCGNEASVDEEGHRCRRKWGA